MNSLILAMTTFAFVGAVTPGPVNILATSTAITQGLKEAIKQVIAASLAYALVVILCGGVMQSLLALIPSLETTMQILGSAFLLYLAYKIFTAPISSIERNGQTQSGWWTGSIAQLLNPKAWLYALSGVSIYVVGRENEVYWLSMFTFVSLLACLISIGLWAVLGHILSNNLENPDHQRKFNRVMAIVLALSVAAIWT
ncbi:LysE family translocator [Grimontia sp. NTOU-MAR1]|uniref:LysE family translocator n=1 Tax=Grimontia sp. NTOU-MAR1 TaxID=3111011 RepID=UPI002DBEEAF1|nr:LysE family translocator [Grimontia sp. NTOU-MAR1]WRW00427.1 LysE family translocator [Grimontia sp. NTOU-MAR1]